MAEGKRDIRPDCEEEFREIKQGITGIKDNDLPHLTGKIDKALQKISRVEGIVYVLVPLAVATVILLIEVLKNGG